jgi:uncharacterized RDD family membrane protein YckC
MDKYNTFWRRFAAGFIDGLILIPISAIGTFAKYSSYEGIIVAGMFITHAIIFFYSVGLHWYSGQTLGKKWMDIRVVDIDEDKLLTFEQAFRRDLVYIFLKTVGLIIISVQIFKLGYYPPESSIVKIFLSWLSVAWFLLEIITMLTDDKNRAFHDIMANSVVIKEEYWKNKYDR